MRILFDNYMREHFTVSPTVINLNLHRERALCGSCKAGVNVLTFGKYSYHDYQLPTRPVAGRHFASHIIEACSV